MLAYVNGLTVLAFVSLAASCYAEYMDSVDSVVPSLVRDASLAASKDENPILEAMLNSTSDSATPSAQSDSELVTVPPFDLESFDIELSVENASNAVASAVAPEGLTVLADVPPVAGTVLEYVSDAFHDRTGLTFPGQRKHESHVEKNAKKSVEVVAKMLGIGPQPRSPGAGGAEKWDRESRSFLQGAHSSLAVSGEPLTTEGPSPVNHPQSRSQATESLQVLGSTTAGPVVQAQHLPVLPLVAALAGGAFLVRMGYPRVRMGNGRLSAWLVQLPLLQRAATRKENLLKSPARSTIFDILRTEPGVTVSSICKRMNKGWGTVYYHLHQLEKNGLAKHVPSGSQRLFFTKDHETAACELVAVIRKPLSRELLEAIVRHPGIRQKEILEQARTSRRVFREYLSMFLRLGLVTESCDSVDRRVRRYNATAAGESMLRSRPSARDFPRLQDVATPAPSQGLVAISDLEGLETASGK